MFSSRFGGAKRGLVALLPIVGLLWLAVAPALARNAYVANSGSGSVSVLDVDTNAAVGTIPVGAGPRGVAITPDGRFAYVTNEGEGTVSVIATAIDAVVKTIVLPVPCCTLRAVNLKPRGIAISPDGQTAWVSNFDDATVSVIGTATNSVIGAPIQVGGEPDGVAISPDGSSVFVAQRSGDVAIVSAATRAVVGAIADALAPAQIAIGPRGGRAFVTNAGSSSVTAFNPLSGNPVGAPIAVGSQPAGIAIEPAGHLAYAASPVDGAVTPIDTALDSPAGGPVGFPGATGIAVKPDGLQGYVTDGTGASVSILDTTRNAAAGAIPVGTAPTGVAVVPNQGPRASFWISPTRKRARKRLTFHAGASADADGKVVDYAWDFGDGGRVEGSSGIRVHRYRRPGTYQVTLVTTDDEDCSTELIYTGQTASCNGTPAAAATALIRVLSAQGPVLRLKGSRRQRLRGRVKVFARCPREPCTIGARGRVVATVERDGVKRRRRLRLGPAAELRPSRAWLKLGPRLPRRTRRAVLGALRRGGLAKARLTVVATGPTGDRTVRTRKVKLVSGS